MPRAIKKPMPIDGLSSKNIANCRSALRIIWQRSHPRKLCIKRATGADGFFRCESCKLTVPKVFIDHITPVGELDGGFLERLFCPSNELRALCADCHKEKTKAERALKRGKAIGRGKTALQEMQG